jgi:glycosyltransferase involved in cell wall biosynthesis
MGSLTVDPPGLRILMLPWSAGNGYQCLLKQAVEATGAAVIPVESSRHWVAEIKQTRPDVLHLHWLHGLTVGRTFPRTFIKGSLFLKRLAAIRPHVRAVVWTCHNLGNHFGWSLNLERKIVRRACSSFDRIIVHHERAIDEVVSYFKIPGMRDRFDVIPHGHFIDWYHGSATKNEARQSLGIPEQDTVLLMFGQLRADKGIENLLTAFARTCRETNARLRLVLAGRAQPEVNKLIARANAEYPGIDYRPGFIADDLVQPLHAAADVAVLPFAGGLTSGSLILAMGFGLPVVAADIGHAKCLVDPDGGLLVTTGNVDALTDALRKMVASKNKWSAMGSHNRQVVSRQGWEAIGQQTVNCYLKAMRSAPH